jgi:hypothetical protein
VKDSPLFLLSLLLFGFGLTGCDTTATQPETQVAVEAYLQAGASVPPVRLSRTVDVEEAYDPDGNAVRGASVVVERLADDSTVVGRVAYTERDTIPGLYTPNHAVPVQAQRTYRLRAVTSEGATITATTTVPGPIEIVSTENDTATYQSAEQPSFTVDVPRRPERQNVFTFTTTSLLDFESTPDSALRASLTPFYADGFDQEADTLEEFRITSSGLLNEGNFDRNPEGTISIDLPWVAVAFFGPNEVGVNIVDKNYYDLRRTQQVQQGGFSPGEIPNVIEHVNGGTGIFGSYARGTRWVFVEPPGR